MGSLHTRECNTIRDTRFTIRPTQSRLYERRSTELLSTFPPDQVGGALSLPTFVRKRTQTCTPRYGSGSSLELNEKKYPTLLEFQVEFLFPPKRGYDSRF